MPLQPGLLQPHSRWWAVIVGLVSLAAVLGCSAPAAAVVAPKGLPSPVPPSALATLPPPKPVADASRGRGPAVGIANFNFVPADLTVPAGTTVVWTNHDDADHTVTASDNSFGSSNISTDGQFSHTFSTPGTYSYFCAIHPFMTARVIVQ